MKHTKVIPSNNIVLVPGNYIWFVVLTAQICMNYVPEGINESLFSNTPPI